MSWIKSSYSGTWPESNCVEVAPYCHCCGGDGQMGSRKCAVRTGSGHCGCHS